MRPCLSAGLLLSIENIDFFCSQTVPQLYGCVKYFFSHFLLYLILVFLIGACQVNPESFDPEKKSPDLSNPSADPTSTRIVLPALEITATITPTSTEIPPTPTNTEIPCLETSGTIQEVLFPSEVLGEDIKANVYFPPCYDPQRGDGYPFLVLLHGQNGLHDQWINLGFTALADEWILCKEIPPMVMVMPFERLFLMSSYTSTYDEAIVNDLLPQLLEQYNLRQEWDKRGIGGLSRGANWAVRIAFEHPEAFGRVGAHSYTTFTGDLESVQGWLQSVSGYHPALWFDIGEDDQYRVYSEPMIETLLDNEITLTYEVNPGGHTVEYWSAHIHDYLSWYTQDWY